MDVTGYGSPPIAVYTEERVSDTLTNNYCSRQQQDTLINEKRVCLGDGVCGYERKRQEC